MAKRTTDWDVEDSFGSDILGTGMAHGSVCGKVKTAQIGFIRDRVAPARKAKAKAQAKPTRSRRPTR